jgi:hypothetical protein
MVAGAAAASERPYVTQQQILDHHKPLPGRHSPE